MKLSNKNNSNYIIVALFIGLATTIGISSLLYLDNKDLENQVLKREHLIKKTISEDSILSKQKSKTDSIINHYIKDCDILINNEKVSTEELLEYMHSQIRTIEKLQIENSKILDSLKVYRSYIELSKSNLNVNYKSEEKDNKLISTIILPTDSLKIYKKLYELMKRDYGISYDIESQDEYIQYSKRYTKLDSALFVYKYYKHVLTGDSLGNITITLPEK
ncbi:MAG: hypothetical protein CVU03_02315 [Bacteroidetes bacterium HGW-Bacteroidetes-2]|jgi:hypothetical protein|nr:MAG: hypothetical protein CVU13_06000 [Bacteroidetes bacterium HGW-Bacteroidetes-8]PKP26729.1 MAG: hypothetical protein CVU03_02315 [Bacteroidetes bacterium HGW-Bacteroidetes-2]